MTKGGIPTNGDVFIADVINQKNISMNTNQALSELSVIIQDVDEFQIANAEDREEISE
jgi:hypothetical protein